VTVTPAGSRPPSERGTVVELLDEVRQLAAEIRQDRIVAVRPTAGGLWWDELPVRDYDGTPIDWKKMLVPGTWSYPMTTSGGNLIQFKYQMNVDRLEFWLELHGGWRVWQRAVFFGPAPAGVRP
jgi:hypothetical protein